VGWAEGANIDLPALRRGKQMTEDFCAKLNINTHSFQSLRRWLKETAAVGVEVKEFAVPMGWKTELGRKGLLSRVNGSGLGTVQELVEYFGEYRNGDILALCGCLGSKACSIAERAFL